MTNSHTVAHIKFESQSYPDFAITDRKLTRVSELNGHVLSIVRVITGRVCKFTDTNPVNIVTDNNDSLIATIEWTTQFEYFIASFTESNMFKSGYFCYYPNLPVSFGIGDRINAMKFPSRKSLKEILSSFGIEDGYIIESVEF
jgi:hypothetical protein